MTPISPDPFRFFVPHADGRPFIVAQLGQSLDGRIATRTGDSKYIGSRASLVHLHRIRAHVDAVLVGIGTVQADDPQLNLRHCEGINPARVVIDARGVVSPDAKLFKTDGARRIVFRASGKGGTTLPDGVEIERLPVNGRGHFELDAILTRLSALGFKRVLVEGGAGIIGQAIDQGLVDRLHLMVSPVLIGSGIAGLNLAPIDRLADARRPKAEISVLGDGEVLFDCDLRG